MCTKCWCSNKRIQNIKTPLFLFFWPFPPHYYICSWGDMQALTYARTHLLTHTDTHERTHEHARKHTWIHQTKDFFFTLQQSVMLNSLLWSPYPQWRLTWFSWGGDIITIWGYQDHVAYKSRPCTRLTHHTTPLTQTLSVPAHSLLKSHCAILGNQLISHFPTS